MGDFNYAERYIFLAEWYRVEASVAKPFYLYYFPADGAIELFDHQTKKLFLRRTIVQGITMADVYIGAKLNIFGRQVDILDYGDSLTRCKLQGGRQSTLGIIKPEIIDKTGEIIRILLSRGFNLTKCRMAKLNSEEAVKFYSPRSGESILPFLMESLTAGPIVVMELTADHAVERFSEICGPGDPAVAREKAADSLRAQFGTDSIKNGTHCSENLKESQRELEYFFSKNSSNVFKTTEIFERCTLSIIKPHAVKEGKIGDIITMINSNGFEITAMKMIHLDRVNCEEFHEVYKGVAPEYVQMVDQLANGPCLAMEIRAYKVDIDTHSAFRLLCGPHDPEVGRQIRPNTIRAKFGSTKVNNAIHCTDLPEDTRLEIEYFFKIIS